MPTLGTRTRMCIVHRCTIALTAARGEAAVAVAESYVKSPYNVVHNPLEAAANTAALDAAARLAAAAASSGGVDDNDAAVVAAAEAATAASKQGTQEIETIMI